MVRVSIGKSPVLFPRTGFFIGIDECDTRVQTTVSLKEFPTKHGPVKVDNDVFDWLSERKRALTLKGVYPRVVIDGKHRYLHALVNDTPRGMMTDHKNRNVMDCTRKNLRTATRGINIQNSKKRSGTIRKFRGVSFHPDRKKCWHAKIHFNKKAYELGYYEREEDAALAYNEGARKLYGEHCFTNKI